MISFKPLGICNLKDSHDSKNILIPEEEEFCSICPVKFYPLQIEAIRWIYWIEMSRRTDQQGFF